MKRRVALIGGVSLVLLVAGSVASGAVGVPMGADSGVEYDVAEASDVTQEDDDHEHESENETARAAFEDELQTVRNATAEFRNVSAAEEAGYVSTEVCESHGDAAMGIHYVNPGLMNDTELNASQPEILLYEPTDDGLELVAVEYLVPTEAWHEAHDRETPSMFGEEFDGPMPGHTPDMPVHYDQHVWLWEVNPRGLFAEFNPFVSC